MSNLKLIDSVWGIPLTLFGTGIGIGAIILSISFAYSSCIKSNIEERKEQLIINEKIAKAPCTNGVYVDRQNNFTCPHPQHSLERVAGGWGKNSKIFCTSKGK